MAREKGQFIPHGMMYSNVLVHFRGGRARRSIFVYIYTSTNPDMVSLIHQNPCNFYTSCAPYTSLPPHTQFNPTPQPPKMNMDKFKSATGISDSSHQGSTMNPGTSASSEHPSRGGQSSMNPMSSKTASSSGTHQTDNMGDKDMMDRGMESMESKMGMGGNTEQMRGMNERIVSFYNLMGWNAVWE